MPQPRSTKKDKGPRRDYRAERAAATAPPKLPKYRPDNVPYDRKNPGWLTVEEVKGWFCRKLRKYASVHRACKVCRISAAQLRKWRDEDPDFERAIGASWEAVVDKLEGAVMQRAIEGYEEPIYQGGELVGTKMRHDPAIQIFMLKANRPQKYGDRVTVNVAAEEYAAQVRDALAAQDQAAKDVLNKGA